MPTHCTGHRIAGTAPPTAPGSPAKKPPPQDPQHFYATKQAFLLANKIAHSVEYETIKASDVSTLKTVGRIIFENHFKRILVVADRQPFAKSTVIKVAKFVDEREDRRKVGALLLRELKYHLFANRQPNPYVACIMPRFYEFDDGCGVEVERFPEGDFTALPAHAPLQYRLDLLCDVAHGLAHLHAMGIVHGDIKLKNFVVSVGADGTRIGKIIDFGAAREIGYKVTQGTTFGDTKPYRSPELWPLPGHEPQRVTLGQATDMWCLGVATLLHVTKDQRIAGLWNRAAMTDPAFRRFAEASAVAEERGSNATLLQFNSEWERLPRFVSVLVSTMLCLNPSRRFSAKQVALMICGWREIDGWRKPRSARRSL